MCCRDVIQLMLRALIAVCIVHLTASVSFSHAAQTVPDCTSVNGANTINFHFWSCSYSCVTNQYRHALCAAVLQRQCGVHCLTGTRSSWAVVHMRAGFFFIIIFFLLFIFLWLLCALTLFPVMRIPLCCNSILSLPAVVSRMKQRIVHSMCVTLLNYLFMNFAVLIMFVWCSWFALL